MIPLFLGVTIFNVLCLCIATVLGYAVMPRGSTFGPYHQLAGVLAAIACCAVHCIVFTYFIATAKWIQHAIDVKNLDPQLSLPTRSFRAQAFPAALVSMAMVFFTAVAGVLRLSYEISAIWHQALALLALATNLGASVIEYRAIASNGRLIDQILLQINGPANPTSQKV